MPETSKPDSAKTVTACILVIGNEILSGRTKDANIQYLASELGQLGIRVMECRVIPDIEATVVATVNEVRAKFWRGEATVQLHGWLATRTALKNECAGQKVSTKCVPSPSLVPAQRETEAVVARGSAYWYCEGTTIKHALFADRPPHTSRLAEGNFYPTREDAKLKRNAIPAV